MQAGLAKMSDEVSAVQNWSARNGIKLNLSKTKVMILGSNVFINELALDCVRPITINGVAIPFANEVKNLGLFLNPTLSWKKHIGATVSKVHRILYSLRHAKHALTLPLRKYLIEALILPHFDYVSAVLSDITDSLNDKLQSLLNACVRFVYGTIKTRDHVTPFRLALGWLSTKRRREYIIASQAYSILAQGTHSRLVERFIKLADLDTVRRSNRRPRQALLPPFAKLEAYKRSFTIQASYILNRLGCTVFDASATWSVKQGFFISLLRLDQSDWEQRIVKEGLIAPHVPEFPLSFQAS